MSIFFTGDNFFQKSQQSQLRLLKQWYHFLSTDTLKPNMYTSRCRQEMSQKWLSVCSGKIKIYCWAFLDGYPVRILKLSYQDMNQKCKTDQTNHIPFLQDLIPICTQKYSQLLNFQVHKKVMSGSYQGDFLTHIDWAYELKSNGINQNNHESSIFLKIQNCWKMNLFHECFCIFCSLFFKILFFWNESRYWLQT